MTEIVSKKCKWCTLEKNPSEFRRDSQGANYRYCKTCESIYNKYKNMKKGATKANHSLIHDVEVIFSEYRKIGGNPPNLGASSGSGSSSRVEDSIAQIMKDIAAAPHRVLQMYLDYDLQSDFEKLASLSGEEAPKSASQLMALHGEIDQALHGYFYTTKDMKTIDPIGYQLAIELEEKRGNLFKLYTVPNYETMYREFKSLPNLQFDMLDPEERERSEREK